MIFWDDNKESFGRCPNGTHKSPSGDCERVTDNKGKPRCPDGFHRSPDGDCERVSNSARINDDDDDDDDNDEGDDNDDNKNHNDNSQKDDDYTDFSNSDRDDQKRSDFSINGDGIGFGCSSGFFKDFDGTCKRIVSEPIVSTNSDDNDENGDGNSDSILEQSGTDGGGSASTNIASTNIYKPHSFFDQRNNRTYMITDSKEIVVLQDKSLINKLAVKDIENPVYDSDEDSIYFIDSKGKLNVFDNDIVKYIETPLKIDDLSYDPSHHYIYATNTAYGKILVIEDQQIIKSLDTGLSKVDYLTYNPSNGYMYGVDKYSQKDIVVINGEEIVNKIPIGQSTNLDYLTYNPSNGYMYGVDSYGGKIIVLDALGIKGNISTDYKVDYLTYNPLNKYMYLAGNEPKEIESEKENTESISGNTTLASGVLQPAAQIQQFNQDTGSGPICCNVGGSIMDNQKDSNLGFGEPSNGNIIIVDGTNKIGSLEFEDLIENIGYNPVDGFLYVLTKDPGKVSLINGTDILDQMELGGNPKNILFTPLNGLAYITKENNYEYSIDVYHNELLKTNIPIKHLYDEIAVNPSNGLVYMLDDDIIYLIEKGSIADKIILTTN